MRTVTKGGRELVGVRVTSEVHQVLRIAMAFESVSSMPDLLLSL